MIRKYLYGFAAFVLAFVVLSVSVLRSSSVSPAYGYSTPAPNAETKKVETQTPKIDYVLPYPGGVLPDNFLWYLKALRDRVQYSITTNPLKKAEFALLYADKRLGSSLVLFEKKKPDIAATTLAKGEKYLEIALEDEEKARKAGSNTTDFLIKLTNASLMHRQVIEEKIMPLAPEDIKPEVVKAEDYAKVTYKIGKERLSSKGIAAPKDPFNGQ